MWSCDRIAVAWHVTLTPFAVEARGQLHSEQIEIAQSKPSRHGWPGTNHDNDSNQRTAARP